MPVTSQRWLVPPTATVPEPFSVDVPKEVLADLINRLKNARLPIDFQNDDWSYGFNGDYLGELIRYWRDEFDWRAIEREINRLPQFRFQFEGIPVHFVHARGQGPDPVPLLLHHGWPWTFWDLHKVIGPLTDPEAYGGEASDSFDVVLLSLPGHGFSAPLTQTGWNFHRTADLEANLMTDILGYDRFAAAGGDWGALVVSQLGHKYPELLHGVYCHLPVQLSHFLSDHPDVPEGIDYDYRKAMPTAAEYGPGEETWPAHNDRFFAEEAGYGVMHLTRPQTVAAVLNDSPVAQLAWTVEKRRAWADTKGDIESVWTKDELCTAAMLYWVTETAGTSARFYKETRLNPWRPSHDRFPVVEAPTALANFASDVKLMPKKWSNRYYNVQQYRFHEFGGHFAPAEVPDTWLADVRDFFRRVR